MLSKKKRLKREEFNRFFSSGKRVSARCMQVVYTPHPTFHASVVVSKKVAKKAVERNRLRRRMYATLQQHQRTGVYILIMHKTCSSLSPLELQQELLLLLNKIQ